MDVSPVENVAELGGKVNLSVTANSHVSNAFVSVKLGNQFPSYSVAFPDGVTGSWKYTKSTGTIDISASGESLIGKLATLIVDVPTTLAETAKFEYTVKGGSYTAANGDVYTFSMPLSSLPVDAAYQISAEPIYVRQVGELLVTDTEGNPAAGVGVYLAADNSLIGTADANGKIATGETFSTNAGGIPVYAKDSNGKISFQKKIGIYVPQGTEKPYHILNNAVADPCTAKSITWLSAPNSDAVQTISYRKTGETEPTTVQADSTVRTFIEGGYKAVRINSVTLSGLTPDTEYIYNVGAETDRSGDLSFITAEKKPSATSFFVLGDIQAEDTTNIQNIVNMIGQTDFDFGIQTGDAVDNATKYDCWDELLAVFSVDDFSDSDIIHVLGNHEYAGEANAETSKAVFGLPCSEPGSYYSRTYGKVYVAVINYAGNAAQLRQALNWLKTDAAESNAEWKVLSIHTPPYFTNPGGGGEEPNALIPPVCDEVGIDVVFSGHDHSYARTKPLTAGEVDEENGTTYFICGSSGEKSYTVDTSKGFKFERATQDYQGLYLKVIAERTEMQINVYDLDGSLFDSCTITHNDPCADGHDFVYDKASGKLECKVCVDDFNAADLEYTGIVPVKDSGNEVYLYVGQPKTGWFSIGQDRLHAGADGILHKVTTVNTRTCTENGRYEYTCSCGATDYSATLWAEGHTWDENHHCTVCGFDGIDIAKADMMIGSHPVREGEKLANYTYTGKAIDAGVTLTYQGKELRIGIGAVTARDGYMQRANNVNVGEGTVTVEGRGDFYGQITGNFTISPAKPTGLRIARTTGNSITVTWDKAPGTEQYNVWFWDPAVKAWQTTTVSDNIFAATGLKKGASYTFCVQSLTVVDGKEYKSNFTDNLSAKPSSGSEGFDSADFIDNIYCTDSIGNTVGMQKINEQTYIFVPANADFSALKMSCKLKNITSDTITLSGKSSAQIGKEPSVVDLAKLAETGADGSYVVYATVDGGSSMPVCIMKSSARSMFITSDDAQTKGRSYVDASKDNEATAQMVLVEPDGSAVYNGALTQLKARGNTTFTMFPKKSYQIKLAAKTDLIGCGETVKTWVLLAGYTDATQMHDKYFKDLAADMGMPYTACADWTDIWYDGEYRGTYLISEKNTHQHHHRTNRENFIARDVSFLVIKEV